MHIRFMPLFRPGRWRASLHLRLVALGLAPLLVAFPLILGILMYFGGERFDALLETNARSNLASAHNYMEQLRSQTQQTIEEVVRSESLPRQLAAHGPKAAQHAGPALDQVLATRAGAARLAFPIIALEARPVPQAYDMIHPGEGDTSTVRSVFLIDPSNTVRLTITYPKSVGRNFTEILRALDALQATDRAPISTPAEWVPGDRVIVAPAIATDDARERFANVDEVKPYLRFADAPA